MLYEGQTLILKNTKNLIHNRGGDKVETLGLAQGRDPTGFSVHKDPTPLSTSRASHALKPRVDNA